MLGQNSVMKLADEVLIVIRQISTCEHQCIGERLDRCASVRIRLNEGSGG
jgi:hypothetical protein